MHFFTFLSGVGTGGGLQRLVLRNNYSSYVLNGASVRIIIINPRRDFAERVIVVSCVCVCVCLSVCLSEHAILAVRAIRSITKDAIVLNVRFAAILKSRFS